LFYFEELKKPNSNINVRTEELLEKIMLAKTAKPNKGNNNGTVLQGAFKGKVQKNRQNR
jgi:hypothetical protein